MGIFVLFFCADGRARARLPRQRANRASSRKLAPILRCPSATKRFPSAKREPAFCGPENAGLGAQTEKKEEKEFFSTVIRSRRGSSDCSSRDRPARKAACMFGPGERERALYMF